MAGAGYKLFNTGDVLTAAQVNTYLQEQTVMVFANATARTTALSGVLAEGMMSYLQDTNAVEVYNGSAWVSVGNTGDITSVVAGTGLSGGGTSGDVTLNLSTPVSATNGGTAQTTYTTGDLLYASAANTLAKRAIGTTGQVLTVSGGVPTWATPATSSSGLTLISRTTWSSASSHTVDNVFTSTYTSYMIVIEDWVSNAFANVPQIQLRYGSTTETSGYYGSSIGTSFNSGTLVYRGTDAAAAFDFWRYSGESFGTFITAYIERVGTGSSKEAAMTGHGIVNTNSEQYKFGMRNIVERNYTGFLLKQSGGTSSGVVTVYGLAKA